jgi:hypothetical protein
VEADAVEKPVRVAGARLEVTDRETGGGITWVLPGPPAIAEHRARFSWRGLDWDYAVTDFGVKLQADVASARGPQTYEFSYHLLGGRQPLVVGDRGDLEGDGFYIPRAFALGADGKSYDAGAWRLLPGQRVAFEFDDSGLPPGAFPYVLDPTTYFKTAAVGDEGDVNKSGFPYPPPSCGGWSDSGSTIVPSRSSNAKPDEFYTTNGFMSWDTSSLPDNVTIASTTLKFYTRSKSNMNSRSLTADWYSAWPIDCSDFSDSAQTSAIGGIPLADIPTPDASTIVTLSGSATGVSRTGRTGLRTHISGDQPLGYNSVEIYQVGNPYNMGNPDLNVTYSLPGGAPSILSATDSPDPVTAGATTTFSVGWSDPDVGDQVRAVICKTSSVTSSGQCANGAWASGGYFSSSPSSVPFVTSPSIAGTNTYYAFACDEAGTCSNSLSGTFTVSSSNTTPTITSVSDSPDPVPAGMAVNFNVGWTDPNSGDSVKAVICKSNSISSGSCPGGSWVSGSLSSNSPASASLTTNSANEGPNPYYAFVCDQANACSSSSLFGTFTVSPPNVAPSITSAGDSPDPVTAGNPMNFTLGWTDPNAGDTVKAVICKTNAIASGSCSGGSWASGTLSSTSPAGASFTTTSANVGTNTYYAFACDQWNACSGSLSGTFTVVSNAAPTIVSVVDSPDSVTAGNAITFSVGWSDSNSGDRVKAVICKTSAIAAGSCSGGTWTNGSLSSTSPASASYTTTSAEIGTNTYYAFVCDQMNACSSSASGTFNVSPPNVAPNITSVSDSPDPAEVGDSIVFNVGWSDPNAGDSVRAVICESNAVSGGVCTGGGLASGHPSQSSPSSATYTTNAFKTGTNTYYAFACDSFNQCSPSLSGTFTVNNTPAPYVTPTMSGPSGQSDADGYPVVRDGNTLTFSGAITQGAGGPPDSGAAVSKCDLVVRSASGGIVSRIAVPASSCRNSNGTLQGSYAPNNLGTSDGSVVLEVEVTRNGRSSGVQQSNPLQIDNAIPVLSAATIGCYSDEGGASCQDRRSIVVDFSEPITGGFMTTDFSVSSNSVLSVSSECNSSRFCDEVSLTLGVAADEANPPTVSYAFVGMMGRSRPVDAMVFALPNAFNRSRAVTSPVSVDQPADIYGTQQQSGLAQSPKGLVQIVGSNVLQTVDAGERGVRATCPREFQDDRDITSAQVRCNPEGRAIHFAERIIALANRGLGTDHDGIPYAPDVVLLQEVRTRDAREIAGHLNSRIELEEESCSEVPRCYRVAISYESSDGDVTWDATETKTVIADTAILYNQRSLTIQGTGEFNTAYTRGEQCRPEVDDNGQDVFVDSDLDGLNDCKRRKVKRHFMARFVEAPTGSPAQPTDLEAGVASIHFATRDNLRNQATHALVKDRWAQRASNRLRMFASSAQLFVLGGDFNIGRCGDEDEIVDDPNSPPPPEPTDPIQCRERDWWRNLTGSMHQFDDSLYVRNRTQPQMNRQYQSGTDQTERRIDFIFVRNTSMTEPTAASRNFTCGLSDGDEDRFRTCLYLPNAERYSNIFCSGASRVASANMM